MQTTMERNAVVTAADGVVQSDLIFDVGMNNGDDTAYYLAKGFRVVAVEANPALVEQAKRRFAAELSVQRLMLYGVAISDRDGTISFFEDLQDDGRGSVSQDYAVQNEIARGSQWRRIEVPGLRMERILE